MAMNEREALTIVETLRRAYPTHPWDDGVTTLYVQQLVRCPYDVAVAATAVHGYIVNEPWMPKVSELLDVIEVEAAGRDLVHAKALPAWDRPANREQRATFVEVLKTVLEEMPPTPGDPDSTYGERFEARARELLEAHGLSTEFDDPDRVFVCTRCSDTGYEIETNDGVTVCIPCPCRPATYDRWRGGHYEPNHSCAECDLLRRGKRP